LTFYRAVSATSVKLLQAASKVVGGNNALARRLGIGETRLRAYMADSPELPDSLLLRAVDIILTDRESRFPLASQPGPQSPEEFTRDG
jgi:hypothetical protein